MVIVLPSVLVKAEELLKNYKESVVNSLCFYDETNVWCFPLFPEAKIVTPMLVQFAILNSEKFKNDIFYYKLQQLTKNLSQELSLEEVYQLLWVQLFDHCYTVANNLKKEVITLSSLINLFGSTDLADSEETIKKLLSAMEKCQSPLVHNFDSLVDHCFQHNLSNISKVAEIIKSEPLDLEWVTKIGEKITEWSNVQTFSNEADQFKDILEVYGLDVPLVYCFSKEVIFNVNTNLCNFFQGIQNFLQQELKSITENEHNMLLFLKNSKQVDTKVQQAIKKLGECKDLRLFIQSKSKG